MIVGHIGARGNSKGVANKNLRLMLGRPLIDWSLDQLLLCERVDLVVVSTDSQEIYSHAISRGAIEIGLRPAHLATDSAAKWNVWEHALDAAVTRVGPATAFLDLDCTAPLRFLSDIDASLDLFLNERPDMVMSCCIARKNPYFNLVELDETGALRISKPAGQNIVARQQAPLVYEHAASTYVLSPDYLRRAGGLFEGRVIPYVMPPERCLDIDSELDFRIVEFLLEERLNG